jgi:hypothetical protein
MTASASPYSVTNALTELQKKYEAEAAAAAAAGETEQKPVDGQMQQMQNDIWRLNMMNLPMNTGGSQLNLYGNGVFDPKTGKQGEVDPAISAARLQQVYAQRPDLIWPGMNKDGTIQREFTGDRYDR